jgi:hypothetical protein
MEGKRGEERGGGAGRDKMTEASLHNTTYPIYGRCISSLPAQSKGSRPKTRTFHR